MEKRICRKCLIEKELNKDNFYSRKDKGENCFRNECKQCFKKAKNNYVENNKGRVKDIYKKCYEKTKEKRSLQMKLYREKNAEKLNEWQKEYREKNREKLRLKNKKWRSENRDKVYNYNLKRKSLKHHVQFTPFQRTELLKRDNYTCQQCNVKVHDRRTGNWNDEFKAHIDHIVPISLGGDSTPENLRILCRTCNISKKDKTDIVIKEDGQIALFI